MSQTYSLDVTGIAAANLVTNEQHAVSGSQLVFLNNALFYSTGLSLQYAGTDGSNRTLVLNQDYRPVFEIMGVVANNPIFGAIQFINNALSGTVTLKYQTVGGNWQFNQYDVLQQMQQRQYHPHVAYLTPTPINPIVVNGSALVLNSATALQQAQTAVSPNNVVLTITVALLPSNMQIHSDATSQTGQTLQVQTFTSAEAFTSAYVGNGVLMEDEADDLYNWNGSNYGALIGSSVMVKAPQPSGDPYTDYVNLMNCVNAAGVGGRIIFPFGKTYSPMREIIPLSRQQLFGNLCIFKNPNQISTSLTAAFTQTTSTFWPQFQFSVASTTGFKPNMRVALEDHTTAGTVVTAHTKATVVSVDSSTLITLQFETSVNSQLCQSTNTTTWLETPITNSYTWPVGTYLVNISSMISSPYNNGQRIGIYDFEFDGNASNNPYGNRWETCPMLDIRSDRTSVRNMWFYNSPSDAMYVGCTRPMIDTVWIDKPNSMGFHIGAASSTGGSIGFLKHLWIDTPGMGTPAIGHTGGLASHPAYAAIGFSRLTDHLKISDVHITNSAGVAGTTWGQAIGCITGSDNFALEFSDIFIRDFNKGIGAIQMLQSGTAGAPNRIDFNELHVENSGPTTPGTFNNWEISTIGFTGGTTPYGDRIRLRNSDFTDSPFAIRDSTNISVDNVTFQATAVANTSTLICEGSGVANNSIYLSNVRSTRPTSSPSGAPAAQEYSNNIIVNNSYVHGNNVHVVGGGIGLRAQSGARVVISSFKAENQYSTGLQSLSSTTEVTLDNPWIRVFSGTTIGNPYAGIDCNSGGGAGGIMNITSPDIEITTTATTQYGIRLCPTAAIKNNVIGGKVKVTGTSTTPILSGGANGIGVVSNVTLSAAFTPGAAETSVGNQVVTNL